MKHFEVFTGNIGKVDEGKELSKGNYVVNFSVAETPRIKKGDEWVDGDTTWTNISIFGDEARNLERSVKPGTPVIVFGERRARTYTVKDTNEERTVQSIVAVQVGIAITKFNFVEKLGNVNYYEDRKQGGQSSGASYSKPKAQAQSKTKSKPKDDFADVGLDDDMDSMFDDDDDLFDM